MATREGAANAFGEGLAWTGFSVYMRTSRLLCTAIPKRSEMRAEAEALVESIKQAVGLLRRHL
jgi:hypothetical protein